jgi:hypothetical protein
MFEIDRAIKVLLGNYPEKCLDLFFGHDREVVFQGVEDPQINIPERRADKVWLVKEQLPMVKEISFVREWLDESEQKGKRSLLLAQLAKRFGALSPELQEQINQLGGAKLDGLSLTILDLKDVQELKSWLANGTATQSAN